MIKLVEVTRADVIESSHKGDIVVASSTGEILHELGDSQRLTFFRSAAKPLLAISMLEAGIVEKFSLSLEEVALIMASHSGDTKHINVLRQLMQKVEISEENLDCGIHDPLDKEVSLELLRSGKKPSKLHCNCSGKHIGFIAAAKAKGYPLENYYQIEHEMQEKAEKVILEFCRSSVPNTIKAIDGCGIPVHAVSLKQMATAYANLCDEKFNDGKYNKSQNYVISAMTMYPEMVAGKGRLDTELMKKFGDRVIGKIGAEGVYCVGIIGKGVGIALKIEDGNSRAVGPAILEVLLQMKVIRKDEISELKEFWNPKVMNHKGEQVGQLKAVFKLVPRNK